jgi:hypothetical protein
MKGDPSWLIERIRIRIAGKVENAPVNLALTSTVTKTLIDQGRVQQEREASVRQQD